MRVGPNKSEAQLKILPSEQQDAIAALTLAEIESEAMAGTLAQ